MLFSNRVLKVGTIEVDNENKVFINGVPPVDEAFDDSPSEEDVQAKKAMDLKKIESKAKKIVARAEEQAEQILAEARVGANKERDSIISQAKTEAAALLVESKEKGYKDGMDSATQEGEAIKAEATKVLNEARATRQEMLDNLEPEVVQIILDVIEKLLVTSVNINPAVIVNLIKQGLESSTITGDVKIYVSAQDYESAMEQKDDILALTDGSVKLEIVKDLSLNPADCVIETPFGSIDSSLGQQYEALRENLIYILSNR